MISYGVFSRAESDDAGTVETIHRVEDDGPTALLWLARYAAYRSYGNLPTSALCDLLRYFDTLREAGDISKEFNLGGQTFYVRELTQDEIIEYVKEAIG